VHDKIGHVAKSIVARREKFGYADSRCYTAFMFYCVLLEQMKEPLRRKNDTSIETKLKKPHNTATRYITLYAASSAQDVIEKDANKINMVLDRSLMWDASVCDGCKSSYNFQSGSFDSGRKNYFFTKYPCPSLTCSCASSHITNRPAAEPLAACENALLMGEPNRFFKMLIIKKLKPSESRATPPVPIQLTGGGQAAPDQPPVTALQRQEDNKEALAKIITYLQTMFSNDNFVPPINMAPL
jgi:hypothetical protein